KLPQEIRSSLECDERVHLAGFINDTRPFYMGIDVLALPTYREGFPNVLLEAASMRVPIVATRVTGCVDAVVDNVTGLLVPPYDSSALTAALQKYLGDSSLREQHGRAGRARIEAEFRCERLWQALADVYDELIPVGQFL